MAKGKQSFFTINLCYSILDLKLMNDDVF